MLPVSSPLYANLVARASELREELVAIEQIIGTTHTVKRGPLSEDGKKRIAASVKARWAQAKKHGKNHL